MLDVNVILNRLKDNLKIIDELTSFNNLNKKNAKKSRVIGKKMDSDIKILLSDEDGVTLYSKWLYSDDLTLAWNAALNLFPIYPTETLKVLKKCFNNTAIELDKMFMLEVINTYNKVVNNSNILITRLKKLYNVDDLSKLNRENI